jgi:hypothetical protein
VVPEQFKEAIVKGGVYWAYMFRDNIEEASIARDDFKADVNNMRRILIPQPYFMRVVN